MNSMTAAWPFGLIAAGATIGFLVGMTGVGAGSLMTPLLISIFGVSPPVAVGTDLLFAAFTKSSAAWRFQKLKNIDWSVLLRLAAGSLPGAILALIWLRWANPDMAVLSALIRKALALLLILSAFANFAYPWLIGSHEHPDDAFAPPQKNQWRTTALGAVLGVVVVLTSVGAGAIGVVALMLLYPRLSARRLIGTDVVHAIPLTLVAGLGHLALGSIDLRVLALLLLGSLPGIAAGIRVTGKAPDWIIRIALGCVLLVAAFMLVAK